MLTCPLFSAFSVIVMASRNNVVCPRCGLYNSKDAVFCIHCRAYILRPGQKLKANLKRASLIAFVGFVAVSFTLFIVGVIFGLTATGQSYSEHIGKVIQDNVPFQSSTSGSAGVPDSVTTSRVPSKATPSPRPTPSSPPSTSKLSAPTFTPTHPPNLTFDEYRARSTWIPYNDLFRNNESHVGKQVWYQAKVIQVIEEGGDKYQIRANVTREEYGWDDTVYLFYSGKRVLQDDIIEFVGTVEELLTYEAIFGQEVTIPAIRVTYSRLVAESVGDVPIEPPTISAMLATPSVTLPAPDSLATAGDATPATPEPIQTTMSMTTQVPTPKPSPTPLIPGLTLEMPTNAGGVLKGANGTEMVVTGIIEDACPIVQGENSFNDPPEEGKVFYMVSVAVGYPAGSTSVRADSYDFSLVGDNRVVYTPFDDSYDDSCGEIPDELSVEIFAGGKTEGNICFQVPYDESGLVLIHQPVRSGSEGRRFLALDTNAVKSLGFLNVTLLEPDPSDLGLPQGLSPDSPLETGDVMKGADGTEIVVTGVVEDAWPEIQAENSFNAPPQQGNRYYMISVEVAYPAGSTSVSVDSDDFRLIGDNRVVYTPAFSYYFRRASSGTMYTPSDDSYSCGAIPDELSVEIFAGGKTEGNICFQIPNDESVLILIHQPGFDSEERRFLAID